MGISMILDLVWIDTGTPIDIRCASGTCGVPLREPVVIVQTASEFVSANKKVRDQTFADFEKGASFDTAKHFVVKIGEGIIA